MRFVLVGRILSIALAVLALLVSRRERIHGALAAYISWMAAANVVLPVLRRYYPLGVHPLHGGQRVLVHVSDTIVLSWTFLFLAVCLHYFVRRGAWAAIAGWCVTAIASYVAYPVSDAVAGRALTVIGLGGLGVTWCCIAWGILRRREMQVHLAHLIIIVYATTDVALFVLPYANVLRDWQLARIANTVLFSVCILAHAWWLLGRPRSARPAVA